MHKPSRVLIRHLLILVMAAALAMTALLRLVDPQSVAASHLRGSQLSWEKIGPTEARFHATFAARHNYAGYSSANVGDTITDGTLSFGDGNSQSAIYQVKFVDTINNYFIAELDVPHDYSLTGPGPYSASLSISARLGSVGGHVNNNTTSIAVATLVDFNANTAGQGSPTSAQLPIQDCPRAVSPGISLCEFDIPATDPDQSGYTLRYRLAGSNELGIATGLVNQPSGATIDPVTGRYRWTTTDVPLSNCDGTSPCNYTYYSTQVVIEKLLGGTVVSQDAVDFFIRFSNIANNPPDFTLTSPLNGATITWQPGTPSSFDFGALDPDSGATVTLDVVSLPGSASFSSTPDNPATGTLSWNNPISGTYPVVLTARDEFGLYATSRTITIVVPSLAPSTLAIAGTGTYGGTGTLTATLTGTGGIPLVGEQVQLTLNGVSVCNNPPTYTAPCPTTDANGVASLNNVALVGLNAGTPYPVGATFLGNTGYFGSSASGTLTLAKADQTIAFNNPGAQTYGGPLIPLTATATSGLPISYTVSGPCQLVNGNTGVVITGAGICTVTASQSGNGNYNAATPVPQTFTIAKADTGTTADDKTVTYGPTSVTLTAQAANISNGASLTGGTVVLAVKDSSNQTLCTTVPVAVSGGTSIPITTTCTFSSPPNAGTYTIEATYSGDPNFNGSSDTATLTVQKANQAITFPDPSDVTYGDGPITLAATSSSALPVSYTASGPCQIINGNQVQITGAGTCTVTANQQGNGNYNAAPPVSQSITIAKKALTVRPANQTVQFGATPPCAYASGYPQGFVNGDDADDLTGQLTCGTQPSPINTIGNHQLVPGGLSSPNYAITFQNGTLTVTQCQVRLDLTMTPPSAIQFSDQATFQAQVVNCGGTVYPTGPVQFAIGSSTVGSSGLDATGLARLSIQVMQNVGSTSVSARFTSNDARFASAVATPLPLTVTREDATVIYSSTAKTTFPVNGVTKKGTVQLIAQVNDITAVTGDVRWDNYAGDVRQARVRFVYASGPQTGQTVNAACENLPVSLVTTTNTKVGTASCTFQSVATTFDVKIEVSNNYTGVSDGSTRITVGGTGSAGSTTLFTSAPGLAVVWREDA